MLATDLIRVRATRSEIQPAFLATDNPRFLERARLLLQIVEEAVSTRLTRGEIESRIENDVVGTGIDHRLSRGLAQVVLDPCTFSGEAPLDPIELRARLFEGGPAHRRPIPEGPPCAGERIAALAASLGCTPEAVHDGLFSDLKENQVIQAAPSRTPVDVLHQYNLVLVQSLLVRSADVMVDIATITPERARQLFRHIKFRQLMYRIEPRGNGWRITLDGPTSILQLSTKYGLQLALFFPALLLQTSAWSLEASVVWNHTTRRMALGHKDGLRSTTPDTGAWVSREEEWFEERFHATPSEWTLERGGDLVDLGGEAVLVPDFTLRKGNRVACLEILGHWRANYLDKRLALLERHRVEHVILAVSRSLLGDKGKGPDRFDNRIVPFSKVIPVKDVLDLAEARACSTTSPLRRP